MTKQEWESRFILAATEVSYLLRYLELEDCEFMPEFIDQGGLDECESVFNQLQNLLVDAPAQQVVDAICAAANR